MNKIEMTFLIICFPIVLFSQTAKQYEERAVEKRAQNDNYGALSDFTSAINLDPKINDVYCNRGFTKKAMRDYKGAVLDFTQAIEMKKKYRPNVHCGVEYEQRADCKYQLGDFRGAILDYTKSNDLYPHPYPNKIVIVNRGLAKYNIGDIEGACLDFSLAGEHGFDKAYDLIKKYCN